MVHRVLPPLFMDAINTAGAVKWAAGLRTQENWGGGEGRVSRRALLDGVAQCALLAYNICIVTRRACASSAHSGCKAQRLKRTRARTFCTTTRVLAHDTQRHTYAPHRARALYIQPTDKENIKF